METNNENNINYDATENSPNVVFNENVYDFFLTDRTGKMLLGVYQDLFVIPNEYKISRPNKTYFENLSMKELVSKFENISPLTNSKTIVRLCGEMNKRVAKILKIYPSKIKVCDIESDPGKIINMQTLWNKNLIEINSKFLQESDGLSILFTLLHETYHTYQFQNNIIASKRSKFVDKNCLLTFIQSTFADCESFIKENELCKQYDVENITDIPKDKLDMFYKYQDERYDVNLTENEANLFAINMLNKFKEKNYIEGDFNFLTCYDKFDTYEQFKDSYNFKTIKKELHNLKSNYEEIKKFYIINYSEFNDEEKSNYNFLFNTIKTKDFDNYYNDLRNRLRQIKTEYCFETQRLHYIDENGKSTLLNDTKDKKFVGTNIEDMNI